MKLKVVLFTSIKLSVLHRLIGANIHEAKYAQSKADFVNKLEISLKECSETEYWLELIFRKGKMSESKYKDLRNKCGSIRRRLIASITTAKEND